MAIGQVKVWNGSAWVLEDVLSFRAGAWDVAAWDVDFWAPEGWHPVPVKVWDGSVWYKTFDKPTAGIVAPVFRSMTSYAYPGVAGPIYINKPAGTVENDILICAIVHVKNLPAQNDLVPGLAWNKVGTSTVVSDSGNVTAKLEVWWRRATASEPTNYMFDVWNSSNNQGFMAAYSGCPTGSSPIDAFITNSKTGTGGAIAATMLGVTTTQANDKLLWLGHNWTASGALTPPTGMTERFDNLLYVSDETIAAAGATGNRTQTQAENQPWAVYAVALKGSGAPVAPTGPTSSLLTAYTPGTDRNDFTGEVGVRLGIGASPFTVSWVGARRHSSAQTGTHTVKLYEWFSQAVERTAVIDYTGVAVGSYAWTAITPITLPAGSYYALLMVVTAFDGQTWCNPGAATYTGMANVYDSYYAGGLQTGGAGAAFIGLDLGW